MTPEAKFWNWMRDKFSQYAHVIRIENSTQRGTPDTYVCLRGHGFWLELKMSEPDGSTHIRNEQKIFGLKHYKAGGNAFVVSWNEKSELISVWLYPIMTLPSKDGYQKIISKPLCIMRKAEFHEEHFIV